MLPKAVDITGAITLLVLISLMVSMCRIDSWLEFVRNSPVRTYTILIGAMALSLEAIS